MLPGLKGRLMIRG